MPDPDAVSRFWLRAARAAGVDPATELPAWSFADTPRLADELLQAVLDGRKTGTSTSVLELTDDGEPVPQPGDLSVVLDGAGAPRAVIRTTSVRISAFDDVDAEFAASEGEDDLSLAAWRDGHERYFRRVLERRGIPVDSVGRLEIVFERFEVVYSESP